jgi:hypothetical protein
MKDFMDYRPGDRVRLVKGINMSPGRMGTVVEKFNGYMAGEHIFYKVAWDGDLYGSRVTHFAQIELVPRRDDKERLKADLRLLLKELLLEL